MAFWWIHKFIWRIVVIWSRTAFVCDHLWTMFLGWVWPNLAPSCKQAGIRITSTQLYGRSCIKKTCESHPANVSDMHTIYWAHATFSRTVYQTSGFFSKDWHKSLAVKQTEGAHGCHSSIRIWLHRQGHQGTDYRKAQAAAWHLESSLRTKMSKNVPPHHTAISQISCLFSPEDAMSWELVTPQMYAAYHTTKQQKKILTPNSLQDASSNLTIPYPFQGSKIRINTQANLRI